MKYKYLKYYIILLKMIFFIFDTNLFNNKSEIFEIIFKQKKSSKIIFGINITKFIKISDYN
jgi:hypothetical protein